MLHFNVTDHPTARWTAHQFVEVFPWEAAPRYLLRDRDALNGEIVERPEVGGLHLRYERRAA